MLSTRVARCVMRWFPVCGVNCAGQMPSCPKTFKKTIDVLAGYAAEFVKLIEITENALSTQLA